MGGKCRRHYIKKVAVDKMKFTDTVNLFDRTQRNGFVLTGSACKELNNEERCVTKRLFTTYIQ